MNEFVKRCNLLCVTIQEFSKLKTELIISDPAIQLTSIYTQSSTDHIGLWKDICTPYVHYCTFHNSKKVESTEMSMQGRMDKGRIMWSIITMGYYPVLRRKEILSQTTTRMNLEVTIISKTKPDTKKTNII